MMDLISLYFLLFPVISGQLSSRESLLTTLTCNIASAALDCGADAAIAVQKAQYGYRDKCGTVCCQYNATDCLVDASNKQDIISVCSGHSLCNVPAQQIQNFCSFGMVTASYIYLEYVCIPKTRITDVCSSANLDSTDGEPLYLTNVGYPGVTVGIMTCTCSFEAQSCSSTTHYYVIDSDLYRETSDCLQNINFTNSKGMTLGTIACESYYDSFATQRSLSSNYIQIKFVSNSTQNRDGLFFIGLTASESNTTVTLSCSQQPASRCIDCGTPVVASGFVALHSDNVGGATANVTCDRGFRTDTQVITCRPTGLWDHATCSPTDCGYPATIENGYVTLKRMNVTTFGTSANVWCATGYQSKKETILCLDSGEWEAAMCTMINKDEKDDAVVTGIIGAVAGIAAAFIIGTTVFLTRKVYRKRKESTTRTVSSPDTNNADEVPNYQQLEPISTIDAVSNYQQLEPISTIGDVHHYQRLSTDAVPNYEQLQPVTRTDDSDHYSELASVTGTVPSAGYQTDPQ